VTEDAAGLRARLAELWQAASDAGLQAELETEWQRLRVDARKAAGAPAAGDAFPGRFGIIAASPAMAVVFDLIEKVAPSNVSVLIQGETGTGKELVAKALHTYSLRHAKPFMAENCAAVPANLLESELFGHTKGSFTGAVKDRPGHFVAADGGTVFLDEIGDMPIEMQAKLLRVLQDGEVRAVGSNKSRKVDVRVVAATNKDLTAMCQTGAFRQDLLFRLNVITIELPPLREREGDVAHLVGFFLAAIQREMGREIEITDAALAALTAWRWPGNVRELENEVQRTVALAGDRIDVEDLSPAVAGAV
jgi:transcriptional regulator with GAF, ATPase, and Fis domain